MIETAPNGAFINRLLKIPLPNIGRNFRRAKLFVGRHFRHQTKNPSLSPDEKFRPREVKVSLVEVQVKLGGKEVI